MSSKTMQKVAVSQFMSITGVNEKMALKLLKVSNWKVDQAADRHKAFYEAIYGQDEIGIEARKSDYGTSTYDSTWKWLEAQDFLPRDKATITDVHAYVMTGSLPPASDGYHAVASEVQPQLPHLPRKYDRKVLSGHERILLDSLSATRFPENILEITSADRQPLPPVLARTLAARDSLRRPSIWSSQGSLPERRLSSPPPISFPQPLLDTKFLAQQLATGFSEAPLAAREAPRQVSAGSRQSSLPFKDPSRKPFSWSLQEILVDTDSSWLSSTRLSRASADRFTGKFANTVSNSYFASNGANSAGSKDTDALGKLFEKYRVSTDDDNMTSVEGTMQYLQDLGVDLESAELFLACEVVQAPGLGELSGDSFVDGWKSIGADTIAKQKAYIAGQVKQLSTDTALFKRVYKHTFVCAKEKGSKALPLENALVYWGMLFAPPGKQLITKSCNWSVLWQDYLKANWTKSVNRDMWNQTLEFFLKVMQDEDLTFWSEDGAWPGVIDDFVAYAKAKRGIVADTMQTD